MLLVLLTVFSLTCAGASIVLAFYSLVAPKPVGYDAHKTRALEVGLFGEAITKCEDEKCGQCYPKALPPTGSGVVSMKMAVTSAPRTITVSGYTVGVPPDVPDYASAKLDYNPAAVRYEIVFSWTDKATGFPMGKRMIPAEQFIPYATYIDRLRELEQDKMRKTCLLQHTQRVQGND